ncbi:Keratin-associated protein 12-1 [Dissostichus eleginoides]|uniref:Keratin-associated protein 12-1 n=1 Tax=Dissostichus eleginoides TaxID=100907 RepID=A0AAD9B3Q0_DISEL|nr:Keratin-associated protein 12-1 [Dissostichus eleginoides]
MKACDWLLPMGGVASVCLPASWAGPRFSRKPEKCVFLRCVSQVCISVNLSHPLSEPVSPSVTCLPPQ